MAGKCTIEGVKQGIVSLDDLLKLNALLDAQEAAEAKAAKEAERR